MIHNEHERRVTARKHAELAAALHTRINTPIPDGRDPEMHQLVTDGIRSQLEELQAELDDYAALNAGQTPVDLPNLENLGEQLIRARIAAGLSQQQLADLTGLTEGVIRRYERDRYQSTSLQRLEFITTALRNPVDDSIRSPSYENNVFGPLDPVFERQLSELPIEATDALASAFTYVRDLVAGGGKVLFVGTTNQTRDLVKAYANRCGMPYVSERWVGGILTNFPTIKERVAKMQEYERLNARGDLKRMPKKEALILRREIEKLQRNYGGLRDLTHCPDAIFVLHTKSEHLAITEANKMGLPAIDIVMPDQEDAIYSGLTCCLIANAVNEGSTINAQRSTERAPAKQRFHPEVMPRDNTRVVLRKSAATGEGRDQNDPSIFAST
jgi:ribosomal protein S2